MDKNFYGLARSSAAYSQMQDLDGDLEELNPLSEICVDVPPNSRLVTMMEKEDVGVEKFRMLAARLQYLRKQKQLKKIVITSTLKGEGKSVVSANLAVILARRQKTLLIDGDLRQSGLKEFFGNHDLPGLTDWWLEATDIAGLLRRVNEFSLWYLPPGEAMGDPLEIVQSTRMSEMLAQVAEWFDWIVIDSPPLAAVADPAVWAAQADGTLLVVEQAKTPKKLLGKVLESTENLKLIGVVVNGAQDASHRYYRQYYKNPSK